MESALSTTTSFLRGAMTFYTDIGQYPYTSFKAVFVEETLVQHFDAATMSILTADLLHERDAIDQVYESRQVLAHALACQWSGVSIQPKTYSDTWLVNGIALHMSGLYLKKLLGINEYRFRMKKDMERVLARDIGTMPPVCQPGLHEPPDPAFLSFINTKAALILHILDRKLGKSGTSLGLSRALPKVFLSAISGDMSNNALSTHSFLRTCRKVSGVDLRTFSDQWIYGSGCPRFGFSASFNRKRMAVEITVRQECPAYLSNERDPIGLALLKPVQVFEGQMTIRIHEADGTPYEHVLDIRTNFKRYEVPFNTKYKRVRRNTKRFLARQAAAAAAAQGDVEAAEAIGMIDMGFGLEVWENIKERENWKVADWTEEDEQVMSGAVYEWIRLDADFEWITAISFEQPDYMWVSQLQRDRDVVAQLEVCFRNRAKQTLLTELLQAVNALSKMPSLIVSSTLTKTALVSNYFYRIRVEAALALVNVRSYCRFQLYSSHPKAVRDSQTRFHRLVSSLQDVHAVLLQL
jgi:transcription initiation factor TFIID subunit 2